MLCNKQFNPAAAENDGRRAENTRHGLMVLKTTLPSTEKITLAFSVSPFNLCTPQKPQNGKREEKLAFPPCPMMTPSRVPAAPSDFTRKVLSCAEIHTQKMGKRKKAIKFLPMRVTGAQREGKVLTK